MKMEVKHPPGLLDYCFELQSVLLHVTLQVAISKD